MGLIELLLGVVFTACIGVGFGVGAMGDAGNTEFIIARCAFVVSALAVCAAYFYWFSEGDRENRLVALLGIVAGLIVFVALPFQLKWLDVREAKINGMEKATSLRGTAIAADPRVSVQPDIRLLKPKQRYEFAWDTSRQFPLTFRKEGDNEDSGHPAFILKNFSSTPALNVRVDEKIEMAGLREIIESSHRLSEYSPKFEGNVVKMMRDANDTRGFSLQITGITEQTAQVVTDESLVTLATHFTYLMALFFVDRMPEELGAKADPFICSANVQWGSPAGGTPQNYRIKITATNTKPAALQDRRIMGILDFDVEKIN